MLSWVGLLKCGEHKCSTLQVNAKLLLKCLNSLHSHQQNKRCHWPISLLIFVGMVRISSFRKACFLFYNFKHSNHCSTFNSFLIIRIYWRFSFRNYQFSSVIDLASTSWARILMSLLILMFFRPRRAHISSPGWSHPPLPMREQRGCPVPLVLVINTTPHHTRTHKHIHTLGLWTHPDSRITAQEAGSIALTQRGKPSSSLAKAHPVSAGKGANPRVCFSAVSHPSPLSH